jgi:hypothetical protein
MRRVMVLGLSALLWAGCTDTFGLPIGSGADLSTGGGDGAVDGAFGSELGPTDGGTFTLPASCARLTQCPAMMSEGDVALTDGQVSGCHAYDMLTIGSKVDAAHDASGLGFFACANNVLITGILSADGKGEDGMAGPGAGQGCGSGGGHGGAGGDPGGCGPGVTYGDPMLPRELGSGGGALGAGGGAGGGAIELEAGRIDVIGFITADGEAGSGASAGGGSGGSILLRADTIEGAGQVLARGGLGFGLAGGGGGGGRVAVYGGSDAKLKIDVNGGGSMAGGDGAVGTIYQTP